MSRPPKPTEILKLTGGYRKDRHAHRADASLPTAKLEAPKWLAGMSLEIFNEMAGDLSNITATADAQALALMADALADYRQARAIVEAEGIIIDGSKGPIAHPAARVMRDAWTRAMAMARQFGLTPASRATLKIHPSPESDPFDEFDAEHKSKSRFFRRGDE